MLRTLPTPLALILIGALFLRSSFAFLGVAEDGYVRIQGHDPWYHMRIVDHLVRNMPHRLRLDPFAQFPDAWALPVAPLFDYLVAGVAWLLGGGNPSPTLVDWVGAWTPPLLGTAICIPVFLLGRRMFGRSGGLAAAAWLAMMPGLLLQRSILGFADHHVAEVLFATLAVLLLVRALECAAGWGRRIGRSIAFGLALAAYLLTWVGGAYLLLVLIAAAAAVRFHRHLRARDDGHVATVLGIGTLVALAAMKPFFGFPLMKEHVPLLLTLGAVGVGLDLSAALARRLAVPRVAFPFIAGILGAGVGLAVHAAAPGFLGPTVERIRDAVSSGAELTVGEARPVTLASAIRTFSIGAALAPLGLAAVVVRFRRSGTDARLIVAVWALLTLVAMLLQRRFAYYLAVPVALFSGHAVVLAASGVRRAASQLGRRTPRPIPALLAALTAIALFYPNLGPALLQAGKITGPDPAWYAALRWLRGETPPPLRRPERYVGRYRRQMDYRHPDSAYGVLAAWDFGYWITRIAQRIPNANPTQSGAPETSRFLTLSKPRVAAGIARTLGTRYVIVDDHLPLRELPDGRVTGGLLGLAPWAEATAEDWVGEYELDTGSGRQRLKLYFPRYYRTMTARLYLFDGREFVPSHSTVVASYREELQGSRTVCVITSLERFATYEEAVAYRDARADDLQVLAGTDPRLSCVPLRALPAFSLVYESPEPAQDGVRSHIKIFEFRELREDT